MIGTENFEDLLKESYKVTQSKNTDQVCFDFKNVEWCGIFELSLLSMWMLELKSNGKEILFSPPVNAEFNAFLHSYEFYRFLSDRNLLKNPAAHKSYRTPAELPTPFYPLKFFDEAEFRSHLTDLYFSNRLETRLKDISESEIFKKGVIREIVLRELGENMFNHARGKFANIIMTKFASVSPKYYKNVSQHEQAFLRDLGGGPFILLVVSDKGSGIYRTLRGSYDKDEIIPSKKPNPSEPEILNYAFYYHSTSRSTTERIGRYAEVISEEAKTFPPATGLFRLMEVLKEYHGFLYLRSGTSRVYYNYYEELRETTPPKPTGENNSDGVEFDGTQFKIYFPLYYPKELLTNNLYKVGGHGILHA
jgi:hypothetical protein